MFLANYGDGLTDAPLDDMVDALSGERQGRLLPRRRGRRYTFHLVAFDDDGRVREIARRDRSDIWINGGYFVFRREIFDYIERGRGARRRAVPAADRGGASCWPTGTTGSGRRWTR